jgi:hypothetical protein
VASTLIKLFSTLPIFSEKNSALFVEIFKNAFLAAS